MCSGTAPGRVAVLLTLLSVLCASCATTPDFSTPEKTHETMVLAFLTEDFDLWLKCFENEEALKEGFLDIGGDSNFEEFKRTFFERNRLIESKVLGKRELSPTEQLLKIQDAFEKELNPGKRYLVRSTTVVRYVKNGDEWKARATPHDTSDMKLFKWVDGKYIPREECTKAEAYAAEAVTGYLDSWDDVVRAYRDFGHCDNGTVAAGFDEAISSLWETQWNRVPEMMALADRNADFKQFIYERVGAETISDKRWKTILNFAKSSCPEEAKEFCRAVLGAARSRQQRSVR